MDQIERPDGLPGPRQARGIEDLVGVSVVRVAKPAASLFSILFASRPLGLNRPKRRRIPWWAHGEMRCCMVPVTSGLVVRRTPKLCGTRSFQKVIADVGSPCVDVGPVAEVAEVTAHQPKDPSGECRELLLAHDA